MVAIEDLLETDHLISHAGRLMQVQRVWSAQTTHDVAHDRRASRPILILPDAIADGIPNRPLRLSAATRVHVPGVGFTDLADLINGATIARPEPLSPASRWHGLICRGGDARVGDGPDALVICGLAVAGAITSHDADAALHGLVNPSTDATPAFDLPARSHLAACRRALADRALCLGFDRITDPGLILRVGDLDLAPDCNASWCRFALPRGPHPPVTLLSRNAIPAVLLGNDEKRRLGVAVCRIMAGRRPIPLTHWTLTTGWHAPEASWRWTNGAATLRLPPDIGELSFDIANTLPAYPLA